jgi:hypothetical protein
MRALGVFIWNMFPRLKVLHSSPYVLFSDSVWRFFLCAICTYNVTFLDAQSLRNSHVYFSMSYSILIPQNTDVNYANQSSKHSKENSSQSGLQTLAVFLWKGIGFLFLFFFFVNHDRQKWNIIKLYLARKQLLYPILLTKKGGNWDSLTWKLPISILALAYLWFGNNCITKIVVDEKKRIHIRNRGTKKLSIFLLVKNVFKQKFDWIFVSDILTLIVIYREIKSFIFVSFAIPGASQNYWQKR